ncbi:HD domain-containing protein [Candidatus Phytoplasma pruni]|uniref:HD domain-containing protein n=2 Tax=Candidatus Phytoplasma pruni TaxID=479893 RepID=A0A851HDQ7_9MOLU|nr:HD domain-containing protein [Candidatus Phytoplasma pruni]
MNSKEGKKMYKNQSNILKEKKIGQKYQLIGKVTGINQGEDFYNTTISLPEGKCVNIKLEPQYAPPLKDKIYLFTVVCAEKKEDTVFICQEYTLIENVLDYQQTYELYSHFFHCSPVSFALVDEIIQTYLDKIQNKILKEITTNLYLKNKTSFLIWPAALKTHHNYYGGLGYHTTNMLKSAESFVQIHSFLNVDLLYAGIILHDMAKIEEFDFSQKKYLKEGSLLGHLVLGSNNIHEEALKLGYQDKEEVTLLKHLLISHHGLLEYGASKRPQTSEALLLWYLDDIDAKLTALGELLEKTTSGEFSEPLSAVGKRNFYKPLFNDKDNDKE